MEKEFYCYIDEGGMCNGATVGAFENPLPEQTSQANIDDQQLVNFYFGKLPIRSFEHHLQMFHRIFPKCGISVVENSQPLSYDVVSY